MKNHSRRQMIDQMEKRFKTTIIGALARFENEFGYLWNGNQEPSDGQEAYFRDKWEDLNNYLNKVEKYHLQIYYNKGDR